MKEAKKAPNIRIGAGVTSIVMVLMVLVFTTFAVLSYTTAAAEERLTTAAVLSSKEYYAAEGLCEETIFLLEDLLSQNKNWKQDIQQMKYLTEVETGAGSNGLRASFDFPLGESTAYRAIFECGDDGVLVISRKVVSTAVWEEEILDVWDGE